MKRFVPLRNRALRISFLTDRLTLRTCLVLVVLAFVVAVASAAIGSIPVSPLSVIRIMFGGGESGDALIVLQFRLPRAAAAFLVGASLAAAGAILQSVIRNPLASPDIVGITGGASVAAVLYITLLETASVRFLPVAAMCGAAAAAAVIYALAWKKGVSPMRLVLIGVGFGAGMSALTTFLIVTSPSHLTAKAMIWLAGTVYGSNWTDVMTLLPWTAVLFPLVFAYTGAADALQLGDETATGVGSRVERNRLVLLILCVALAGSAVAVGGAIGFIGLIAPHIARRLVGSSFGGVLPVAALTGGIVVAAADLFARTAFAPLDLPVGLFTALIGAPFFIYLLYKHRHS